MSGHGRLVVAAPVRTTCAAVDALTRRWCSRPLSSVLHMTAEQMAQPDTRVSCPRGRCSRCVRRAAASADGVGEVKRMYTLPSHSGARHRRAHSRRDRGRSARTEGFTRLVLETGHRHPAAWRVYERAGFTAAAASSTIPTRSTPCSTPRPRRTGRLGRPSAEGPTRSHSRGTVSGLRFASTEIDRARMGSAPP